MRRLVVIPLIGSAWALSSCGETVATGEPVAIPRVFVTCATAKCKTSRSPEVVVVFSTFGCDTDNNIRVGETISGSLILNCTSTAGCDGEITSWISKSGASTMTVPSGTYSLCARADFGLNYPEMSDDAVGVLNNVSVGTTTSNQFITNWTDL